MRVPDKYDLKENSFTICVYVWKNVYLSNAVLTIFLTNLGDLRMAVILTCQTIFVYFVKKSVTSSLRQVRPMSFWSTKFCQGFPNFKDAVVPPWSRINFSQARNLTDLLIYKPWFEGKCQSRKFVLHFISLSISVWSPPAKIISYLRGNQTVKIKDSYLGMLHNDLYSDYNYYGSQVYVPGRKKLEYKQ